MISATVLTSSNSINAPKDDIQSPEQLWLRITMTNRLDKPLNQIEADKLFERFYRHDKTNTMHSGTGLGLGLGLSIVQAIANAHNGKVSITIKDECLFEVAVKLLIAR